MRQLKAGLLTIYTLFIAYVSLANDSSPEASVPDLNSFGIANLDKIAHSGAYGLFAVFAVMVFGTQRLIVISVALFTYGMLLELFQTWVPLREPSLADVMANSLGILAGSLFMYWLSGLPKNYLSAFLLPNVKKE